MRHVTTILITLLYIANICAEQSLLVGGDISVLQSYNDNNVDYYQQDGSHIDNVLAYMGGDNVGWNAMRVRLFVYPKQTNGDGDPDAQVCQDIEYAVKLCKRIKQQGFKLLLDIHYSDTWADPSNQWIPEEWASLTEEQLQTKVYTYTKESLESLVQEGATPDFIQVGNEISYGMLWSVTVDRTDRTNRCFNDSPQEYWDRFINFLNNGARACREVCPNAKIIIHTERSGDPVALTEIYQRLSSVDYDIIGLSYYPFWHNSLEVLSESLETLATDYPNKPVHIVETAYYYQYPSDIEYDFSDIWPYTPEGQAKYIDDLNAELKKHSNVEALYWWFPEENGNGPDCKVLTDWINRGLWDNSTHMALPGLYNLKGFLNRAPTAITESTDTNIDGENRFFDLSGRELYQPDKNRVTIEQQGTNIQKVIY